MCILITWNWSIPVNFIKISFPLKKSIQTFSAVNIFFKTEQNNESQIGCLSTIEVSAESNDSGVEAWLILLTNCVRMTYRSNVPKEEILHWKWFVLNQIQKALDFTSQFFLKLFSRWPMWVKKFKKLTSQTIGKQCCLGHTKEFSHSLPNLLKTYEKNCQSVFQEDACYVIRMFRKLFISMLNLSQAMQGPAEKVL